MSEIHCRRTVIGYDDRGRERPERCPWRGTDLTQHVAETLDDPDGAHVGCRVCGYSLSDDERRTCDKCIERAGKTLQEIEDAYATLPIAVESTSYRMRGLPDALVMSADGSMASPQTPNQYTEPRETKPTVHVEHPEMVGEKWIHSAFVEERIPSDGREHVRDHWPNDPVSVLALLEANERDWRHEFGHQPAEDIATVSGCIGYLRGWLTLAARTHPAFDEFYREIRTLRSRLLHTLGESDDPQSANADCTRCGGRLFRAYREPLLDTPQRDLEARRRLRQFLEPVQSQREAERSYGVPTHRLTAWPAPWQQQEAIEPAHRGQDDEGLDDVAVCAGCGHEYTSAEYRVALRIKALASATGWLTIPAAAGLLERPERTVWTWMQRMALPSACRLSDGRVVVEADAVKAKARTSHSDTQQCA